MRCPPLCSITRPICTLLSLAMVLAGSHHARAQVRPCCIGSTCSLRTQTACENAGGDWLGTGSSCSPNPCASPPGTCCNGTICSLKTDAQCASGGGSFLGGTTCAPNPCSGSCCLNGNCSITSSSSCASSGGAWLRFGSCSTTICAGPCCRNGVCAVTVQSLCTSGGVWTPGGACFPNPCAAPQCSLEVTANTGGETTAVARVGTTGLLVARGRTLEMYNAANINAPAPFSPPRRVIMPDVAVEIVYSASTSRAFVLLASGDVFYATIVTTPQLLIGDTNLIGGVPVPDIEVEGDRVFIPLTIGAPSDFDSDVFIYERGADGLPDFLATFEPFLQNFAIDRLAKVGNTLWLGMHQSSTYAIEGWDVSNPAAPIRRGSIAGFADLSSETEITGMQVIGTKLLVSFYNLTAGPGNGDNLRVADVSNPAAPFWHPEFPVNGRVQCMSANGNHLRVGVDTDIQTWDTTNPAALTLLGTFNGSPAIPAQITAGASTDYVALGKYGLQTISFTLPATPQARSLLTDHPAHPSLVRQTGVNTVVYDALSNTLRIFDYTLSQSAQLRGSVALPTGYFYMMETTLTNAGSQRLACLGDSVNGRVVVVDVTIATAPVVRSTITDAGVWLMSVTGSRLYIITSSAELKVYDLTNAASPSLLGTTQYGGSRSDYTCITSWQSGSVHAVALGTATFGLWLIDATNAASPQIASVHTPVTNYRVEALNKGPNFLYIGSSAGFSDSRLESLVVTSLSSPTVHYATGPGIGASEPGTFQSLNFITGPTGRFLIGVSSFGSRIALWDLAGPLGEGVMYLIDVLFTEPVASLVPNLSHSNVMVAAGSGGLLQISLPQTWAPGFSAPAFETRDVCLGGSVVMEAHASANPATITYQWFRDGSPATQLTDGVSSTGSMIAGATTPTLTISNLRPQDDSTFYHCVATNSCGSRETHSIRLEICIADINCSGSVTVQDIFDFLGAYFAGGAVADVNGSGSVTVQDIFDFLAAYFAGCA